MEIRNKEEILVKLELDIIKYNKIFLILDNEQLRDKQSIYSCFHKTEDKNQNILILSVFNNPIYLSPFITYRLITKEDAEYICDLYHMYEFSDRFFLISKERQYGVLFNFVNIGLINPEEAWEALVYH